MAISFLIIVFKEFATTFNINFSVFMPESCVLYLQTVLDFYGAFFKVPLDVLSKSLTLDI